MAINVNHVLKLGQAQDLFTAFGTKADARFRKVADKVAKTDLATALSDEITASTTGLATLVGSDTGKSARTIAAEELAAQLIPATAQEALDTLQEIAAWIQSHPAEAAAINAKLQLGTHEVSGEQVEYSTVKAYVEAYVAEQISDAELEGSNAIDITDNVVSLILDTANANGLEITSSGLKLKPVVPSESGTGGSNGAMTAAQAEKLAGLENYVHPSYTATTGAETGDQTPGFGATFNVSQVTSDTTGHVTGQTTRTVTIPDAAVVASSNGAGGSKGLMTPADKEKLDGIEFATSAEVQEVIDGLFAS